MSVRAVATQATAVLLALALVAGCGSEIAGTAVSGIDAGSAGGLPVTEGPSGPRDGVPPADIEVRGSDGGDVDTLAVNAVADVQEYFRAVFPADFDREFADIRVLASYDSEDAGTTICGADTDGLVNAFYCPAEDTIAWDRGVLLPSLAEQFGPMAVVLVLAHEIGHAVQSRLEIVDQRTPTIVSEQQADCFAGGFMRTVAEGDSEHFELSTGEGLNNVLAAMFLLRDQVGASLTKRGAHGSAFDRVAAFQIGFTEGAKRCAEIDVPEIESRATELSFDADDDSKGNLDIDERSLDAVTASLEETFAGNETPEPAVTLDGASCGSGDAPAPASYCPDSNTIAVDLDGLEEIGTPRSRADEVAAVGDFAAFGLFASRWALSVQHGLELEISGVEAGLRSACLVGVWAGLHIPSPFGNRNPIGDLRLSPGDLDEAVATLLKDGQIAADVNGDVVPSGFARVEALRVGFLEGAPACSDKFDG